ncbi:MAG: hypothetical protein FWG03_07760 [Clostridiales bacterium]|nr:hypothetical protein [Clostridiales bacterium]
MKQSLGLRIFILVCLNAALYALIVVLDIIRAAGSGTQAQGHACDCFKYAAIVSCLLICLFAYSQERQRAARVQAVVFCFTLAADFFLLFTPYFTTGVFIFLGAHLSALVRYRPRMALPAGALSAATFTAVMLFLLYGRHLGVESALFAAVSLAYAVLIISVTVSTFHCVQPRMSTIFSRLGMFLFIACDINVMAFNVLPDGNALHTAAIVLMWAFYLPAQTLLALSAALFKEPARSDERR